MTSKDKDLMKVKDPYDPDKELIITETSREFYDLIYKTLKQQERLQRMLMILGIVGMILLLEFTIASHYVMVKLAYDWKPLNTFHYDLYNINRNLADINIKFDRLITEKVIE